MNRYIFSCFHSTVLLRFGAACGKYIKLFFDFCTDSMTAMLYELTSTTFSNIVHNAKFRFDSCLKAHSYVHVRHVYAVCL